MLPNIKTSPKATIMVALGELLIIDICICPDHRFNARLRFFICDFCLFECIFGQGG